MPRKKHTDPDPKKVRKEIAKAKKAKAIAEKKQAKKDNKPVKLHKYHITITALEKKTLDALVKRTGKTKKQIFTEALQAYLKKYIKK